MVGDFKNGGPECRPQGEPEEVRVHDFCDVVGHCMVITGSKRRFGAFNTRRSAVNLSRVDG